MPKSYGHKCPVALTLDVIGERWTILILRDLFLHGPRRFQDLIDNLDGIGPNTLSDRLRTLERAAIVRREFYEDHPPRASYHLTAKGESLRPVLVALRDWGKRHG